MTNADSQNTMQIILIAVLLLCGYLMRCANRQKCHDLAGMLLLLLLEGAFLYWTVSPPEMMGAPWLFSSTSPIMPISLDMSATVSSSEPLLSTRFRKLCFASIAIYIHTPFFSGKAPGRN